MRHWWFSSNYATGYVQSDGDNMITDSCPIWQTFKGQHIKNLADWLKRKGGFKYFELSS